MRKKINAIAGLLFLAIIGGCIAAYPIEDRRIGGFCDSVAVGSSVSQVVARAHGMFGIDVWERASSGNVVVKSNFTFKTLCFVQTKDGKVVSASFSND